MQRRTIRGFCLGLGMMPQAANEDNATADTKAEGAKPELVFPSPIVSSSPQINF
jgi:hypothetical protein